MNQKFEEKFVKILLFVMALSAILSVLLITVFVFKEGIPIFHKYGIKSFILGKNWNPTNQIYGVFPMIIGTLFVTFVAILIGTPTGIATAIFLAEIAPKSLRNLIKPAVELLAGLPSVIYGLFGMVFIKGVLLKISRGPLHEYLPANYQMGYSALAAGIVLAIMILPTIINISEDAIRAVPHEYKEGSLALGATKWETIIKVIIPAAKSGIITSIVLGIGRAVGETMAVIMIAGNVTQIPDLSLKGLFAPVRTLTGNIAIEMGYAGPEHQQALFATGIILFVFIFILNLFTNLLVKRGLNKG